MSLLTCGRSCMIRCSASVCSAGVDISEEGRGKKCIKFSPFIHFLKFLSSICKQLKPFDRGMDKHFYRNVCANST